MALAQPTGLQVQALSPLVEVSQAVERHVSTDVLLAESGDVLATEDSRDLASERLTLVSVTQMVDDSARYNEGGPIVTLSQQAITYSESPRRTLISVTQSVERHNDARALVTLSQRVLSPAVAAEPQTFVTVGGVDVTDMTTRDLRITASEGDNRTASIRLVKLPTGPLDVPAYQGQSVDIVRLIDGEPVTIFTGTVERPTYSRDTRSLLLECSDLRHERIGKEGRDRLKQMTGGLFSAITQRDDATGRDWVDELMRTVPGSLDYTSEGVLRYSPWAVGTPDHVLQGNQIHYKEADLEFSTRSEIVNTVRVTLEYRWFRRNTLSHAVSLAAQTTDYCKLAGCTPASRVEDEDGNLVDQILPTRAAIRSAAEAVSNWQPVALDYIDLPPDGWYRKRSDATRKLRYSAIDLIRETRCMGADITLERYISQPKRETYSLTISAPQSVDQYGEVEGKDMRFSVESRTPPDIYEERGCSIGTADDRRSEVEQALTIMQRMGQRKILEAHRQNFVGIRYKPGPDSGDTRGLLPVEIGQTIQISDDEVAAIGTVTEFQHAVSGGDYWTDIRLAVSRVDSSLSVSEDWALPSAPASYALTPPEPGQLETPDCPAPVGEVEIEGDSRLEPDGTVIIVAPAVDRSQVDEIQGERATTYSVAIPTDPLSVEVI